MRIGVVGPMSPDSFAENITETLRGMGHAVASLGPAYPPHRTALTSRADALARQALTSVDEWAQRKIVRAALNAECEVIISVDARIMPRTVTCLKSSGARVALWFPDSPANLGRQLMLLAPYDAIFFKEPHVVDRLAAMLDLPVYYLPEACNPQWHRPLAPAGTEPYLIVAGNMYPSRVRLLERLHAKGIPLKLYGSGFPRWIGDTTIRHVHTGMYLAKQEKARSFRTAAGVLNNLHPAEFTGVNARLFEAAGCGAAVLTEYRPALADLFAIGHEVLAFRDFDDIVDHATHLLSGGDLTARLGNAAALRAHRDHSYERRLITILEKVS
jgi:spore maturation protein CgeB